MYIPFNKHTEQKTKINCTTFDIIVRNTNNICQELQFIFGQSVPPGKRVLVRTLANVPVNLSGGIEASDKKMCVLIDTSFGNKREMS